MSKDDMIAELVSIKDDMSSCSCSLEEAHSYIVTASEETCSVKCKLEKLDEATDGSFEELAQMASNAECSVDSGLENLPGYSDIYDLIGRLEAIESELEEMSEDSFEYEEPDTPSRATGSSFPGAANTHAIASSRPSPSNAAMLSHSAVVAFDRFSNHDKDASASLPCAAGLGSTAYQVPSGSNTSTQA